MSQKTGTVMDLENAISDRARERGTFSYRIAVGVLTIAYGSALLWAYRNFIATSFTYLGYSYKTPDSFGITLGFALASLLSTLMPKNIRRPGDFLLWAMFIIATVPSLILPHVVVVISPDSAIKMSVAIAVSWSLTIFLATRKTSAFMPMLNISPGLIWVTTVLISLATYAYMFATTGIELTFIKLDAVLDTRLEYRNTLSQSSPLLAYAILLQGNVLNPLFIATGISRRFLPALVAGLVGQALIYSVTGYKTIILSTGMIIAVVAYQKRGRLFSGRGILAVTAGLCLGSASIDQLLTDGLVTQIFVNRVLATPGVLTAAHVWVFDQVGFVYWSNSFLSSFIEYPHSVEPSFIVGDLFSNSPITSANANIFADGYMNLGYSGVILESVILGFLIMAVNSAARHAPLHWVCGLMVVPSFALSNTGVFTAVLTHGFLAICLLVMGLSRAPREGAPGADNGMVAAAQSREGHQAGRDRL